MSPKWRWCLMAAAWLLSATAFMSSFAWDEAVRPQITITERSLEQPAAFQISGLPISELDVLKDLEPTDPKFSEILSVRVIDKSSTGDAPPLPGRCRVEEGRLIFTPRYPPVAGVTYRLAFNIKGGTQFETRVTVPQPKDDEGEPARVKVIYPTADTLPENHLRFYIHFSQPMAKGEAYEHLALLDATGQAIDGALLEIGEELWDPSGKRLTLLLDPGRIKRGLKPREELGPILEEGKRYTLLVKGDWPDRHGRMLGTDYRKEFKAGPALEKALDPAAWKLTVPRAKTANLLVVQFPQTLDQALLERTISVLDPTGLPLGGRVTVLKLEQGWSFFPRHNWQPGTYQLVVDTVLEDTAGNRIGRAFEVDEQETITRQVVSETVKIPFEIIIRDADRRP